MCIDVKGWEGCHRKYREDTYVFIEKHIVATMADQRHRYGLPAADDEKDADEYDLECDDCE